MNFDDLKDRIKNSVQNLLEKIQESSLYLQLRDRYENLSPAGQKITLWSSVALFVLILVSLPLKNFNTSRESVSEFQERRDLIRQLYKVTQEASSSPNIPPAPDVTALRSRIQSELQLAQLLPEQINEADVNMEPSNLIPEKWLEAIIKVSLSKLNLRQIVDLGYQLSSLSPAVKMKDLDMHANPTDTRYYDVVYKLAVLRVPELKTEEKEETPAPVKKKVRK